MGNRFLGAFVAGMSFVVACGDSGGSTPTTDAGADGTTANDAANDAANDVALDVVVAEAAVDSGVCNVDAGLTVCGPRCVDLVTSVTDCGQCNKPCTNGTCSASTCTCKAGFVMCNPDGCQDTTSSVTDCGTCGHPCGVNQTCVGGNCQ
jgi:hypothetical protein